MLWSAKCERTPIAYEIQHAPGRTDHDSCSLDSTHMVGLVDRIRRHAARHPALRAHGRHSPHYRRANVCYEPFLGRRLAHAYASRVAGREVEVPVEKPVCVFRNSASSAKERG